MDVKIPYGRKQISVSVHDSCEVVTPNVVKQSDPASLLENALQNPLGAEGFTSFLGKAKRLLVIVNDATRPTPTAKILDYLSPKLSAHPDITFLIATGVHRAPTVEEFKFIFGNSYADFKHNICVHDARKDADMTYLGRSSNGTEMYINSLVPEIGNVLTIGSVEPHYFAGYTGGRKSFLPGVASYKTIEMNHKLALSDNARPLALAENPVHQDMVDAMNVLSNINVFSIQTVLTGDHNVYAVTAGDLHTSFDAAIAYAQDVFCVSIKKKGDIVITAAPYPMDIDLYQSQKALDNGKLAVTDKGIIILVSKCRMGVGEDAFLDLLCQGEKPEDILRLIGEEYKLGYHKAAKMAQIGINHNMWAVSDLDDTVVRKAKLTPFDSIQTAVDEAVKKMRKTNKHPHIIIMPQGSLTVPYVESN